MADKTKKIIEKKPDIIRMKAPTAEMRKNAPALISHRDPFKRGYLSPKQDPESEKKNLLVIWAALDGLQRHNKNGNYVEELKDRNGVVGGKQGYKTISANFDFEDIPTNYSNAVWEIRDSHDLSEREIEIPSDVTLLFNGGRFTGAGTITFASDSSTTIVNPDNHKIFDIETTFVNKAQAMFPAPQWFGAKSDGITGGFGAYAQKTLDVFGNCAIPGMSGENYIFDDTDAITLGNNQSIFGVGMPQITIIGDTDFINVVARPRFEIRNLFLYVPTEGWNNWLITINGQPMFEGDYTLWNRQGAVIDNIRVLGANISVHDSTEGIAPNFLRTLCETGTSIYFGTVSNITLYKIDKGIYIYTDAVTGNIGGWTWDNIKIDFFTNGIYIDTLGGGHSFTNLQIQPASNALHQHAINIDGGSNYFNVKLWDVSAATYVDPTEAVLFGSASTNNIVVTHKPKNALDVSTNNNTDSGNGNMCGYPSELQLDGYDYYLLEQATNYRLVLGAQSAGADLIYGAKLYSKGDIQVSEADFVLTDQYARIASQLSSGVWGYIRGAATGLIMESPTGTRVAFRSGSASTTDFFRSDVNGLTIGNTENDVDPAITFAAATNSGIITWMEDEDYFKFSDNIFMYDAAQIFFRHTNNYIYSGGNDLISIVVKDLQLYSNAIDLGRNGVDTDTVLQFMSSTNDGVLTWKNTEDYFQFGDKVLFDDKIMFTQTDGNEYIDSLNDGYLDLGATTGIRLHNDVIVSGNNLTLGDGTTGDPRITFDSGNDGYMEWQEDELQFHIEGGVEISSWLNAGSGIILPNADPHIVDAWWDNAGTLTKSAG